MDSVSVEAPKIKVSAKGEELEDEKDNVPEHEGDLVTWPPPRRRHTSCREWNAVILL